MRSLFPWFVLLALLTFSFGAPRADFGFEWTAADGQHKIESELVELKDDGVTLKRDDGAEITVPLRRLSKADRQFVQASARSDQPSVEPKAGHPAHDPLHQPALNPIEVLESPEGDPVVLVKDGKPAATVVIPADDPLRDKGDGGSGVNRFAAKEFVTHVKLATGAELPIVTDRETPQGMLVLLGDTKFTKERKINVEGLPLEAFRVKTFPRGIAIVQWGNSPFGVYDVLERFLGIRWYYPTADGTIIPPTPDLVIPQVHYTDAPVRKKRAMWPFEAKGLPDNECRDLIPRYRVGSTAPGMINSAFGFLAHYYDQYPEIFERLGDGKRNKMIPCFGNPKTLELTLKDLEGLYERGDSMPFKTGIGNKHPWQDQSAIHIQPWDEDLKCTCEYCTRIKKLGPNPIWGDYSRVMGTFVANLAKEVQKRWPDKKIYYLPYMDYTTPPMDVKFPPNVYVQICPMYGVGTQKEPEVMAAHDAWIAGWYKLTGHPVQLWEYQLWPTLKMPFQYPHVIQQFQKKHRDDYVGSFINGLDGPTGLPGDQWAQQAPTLYCWFRLLWNPDFDVDAALAEYVELMYGPAKLPMGKILKQLTDRWENVKWKGNYINPLTMYRMYCVGRATMRQIYTETMPPSEVAKLKENLAQARKLVDQGSVYERRVNFIGTAIDRFADESKMFEKAIQDMTVVKAVSPPMVDGRLNDACWHNAERQEFVMAMNGLLPKEGTTVQTVCTREGLYLGFKMAESQMEKLVAKFGPEQNTTGISQDDSIEIYLDPEGKRLTYKTFIVNSRGALSYTPFSLNDKLKPMAAAFKGKDFWSVEVFLPLGVVSASPANVATTWSGNFCRNRRAGGGEEVQRWNTQLTTRGDDPTAFGSLKFDTKKKL